MSKDTKSLAWIDLETSGTNQQRDKILEVACITTDSDLNEIDRVEMVVGGRLRVDSLRRTSEEVVQKMHDDNGLWDELVRSTLTLDAADEQLRKFLGAQQWALAGSGVAHFDSRFIRAQMPRTATRLTYWTIDVGVIRRFLRNIVGVNLDSLTPFDADLKAHRAMADIEAHLTEARIYRDFLGTLL